MKFCKCCNQNKQFSEFNISNSKKDGLQTYCRTCSRERHRKDYLLKESRRNSVKESRDNHRKINNKLVNRYKSFCGCKFCGLKEVVCLDLHHLDPSLKEENVSVLVSYSRTRLKDEIRKCIVVCSNCHRKIHAGIMQC